MVRKIQEQKFKKPSFSLHHIAERFDKRSQHGPVNVVVVHVESLTGKDRADRLAAPEKG